MRRSRFAHVLTSTIPVMMGYVPLGIVFGFLMVQNGASWWHAPLMSLMVFAGAAQFLAIGLLSVNATITEIATAVTIVNLRHIFYGVSVVHLLPRRTLGKFYFISTLTDENYSLLTGMKQDDARQHSLLVMVINHSYWVGSALAGSLIGTAVTTRINGLEFSLTALFTVLAVEQYRRLNSIAYPLVAIWAYVGAGFIAPANPLFPAICLAIVTVLLMPTARNPRINQLNKEAK